MSTPFSAQPPLERKAKPAWEDLDYSHVEWQKGYPEDEAEQGGVEIAVVDEEWYVMRNSRHPEGPYLVFDQAEWDAFVAGAKDGEFDLDTFDLEE